MKFEYTQFLIDDGFDKVELVRAFNEMGKERWQVVTAVHAFSATTYTFMREVQSRLPPFNPGPG